jgi:hypothetical protein
MATEHFLQSRAPDRDMCSQRDQLYVEKAGRMRPLPTGTPRARPKTGRIERKTATTCLRRRESRDKIRVGKEQRDGIRLAESI